MSSRPSNGNANEASNIINIFLAFVINILFILPPFPPFPSPRKWAHSGSGVSLGRHCSKD